MDPEERRGRPGRTPALPAALATIAVAVALERTWIADDGFITLRVAENLAAGHGLVWNLGERVQVSVHPLWTLLLGVLATLPVRLYLATVALSLVLVWLAVFGLARHLARRAPAVAGLAVGAYVVSDPLVDFSTGGLENPLSIALLTCFGFELVRAGGARPAVAGVLGGLAILARLDHALLVLPPLVAVATADPRLRSPRALAGLAPAVALPAAWVGFSLFYFGFALPNVKYAKLHTGIPAGEFAAQGLVYLGDLARHHPESLLCLVGGAVALGATALRRRSAAHAGLLVGLVLFVGYVVRVGGDFMSGRFFVAPVWLGLMWAASRIRPGAVLPTAGVLVVAATLGDAGPAPARFDAVREATGIGDERRYYHGVSDLWSNWPDFAALAERSKYNFFAAGGRGDYAGPTVYVVDMAGMVPYLADPRFLWIDRVALTDPLLARLRMADRENWRIGHYYRRIPEGYLAARLEGDYEALDPRLATLLDDVRLAISGPLLARGRLGAIRRLNTGHHDAALAAYLAEVYPDEPEFSVLSQFLR